MRQSLTDIFFALLRAALGAGQGALAGQGAPADHNAPAEQFAGRFAERPPITEPLSGDDWKQIFSLSKKQALLGVIYSAVQRLPQELQPPKPLMDKWNQIVRQIIIRNNRMNATAARLTRMFAERGRRTVILKGQANALLYPDPYLRQAGDIDILVEGGRQSVIKLLDEMGVQGEIEDSGIHMHANSEMFRDMATGEPLPAGVSVEIHFLPTYNPSPFSTRRMNAYLSQELAGNAKLAKEGFYAPPATYALVMQLSHLQRHYFGEGIGLRQLVDYCMLLRNSTAEERSHVAAHLKSVGLYHLAQAVMWVMESIFALPRTQMLCAPDETRGKILLESVLEGGNFGKYSQTRDLPTVTHWFTVRSRMFRNMRLDIPETLWNELNYAIFFVRTIPRRIKSGKASLRNR